eukprot:3656347-Pleurochrysis_carterae.AAC.1
MADACAFDILQLRIEYAAITDEPTLVNLTNHTYWNLKDGGRSNVLNHQARDVSHRAIVEVPSHSRRADSRACTRSTARTHARGVERGRGKRRMRDGAGERARGERQEGEAECECATVK